MDFIAFGVLGLLAYGVYQWFTSNKVKRPYLKVNGVWRQVVARRASGYLVKVSLRPKQPGGARDHYTVERECVKWM